MARDRVKRPAPLDPAEAANQRVLDERQKRIVAAMPEPIDLGLNLEEKEPASVDEFIDEWDRKAFGDPVATITKTVYGPDPLIDQCPQMRAAIEQHGLHDYAALTREAVMTKGAAAFSDVMLQRGARAAINKFGKEAFAQALMERILKIPSRTVEIDASDVLDPMIQGGNVLRDTVEAHKRPGMSYRFFSDKCLGVLGWRGYVPVKDAQTGEVVKAGTLILGEIRAEVAQARRDHFVRQSEGDVREIEDAYRDALARPDATYGYRGAKAEGISAVGAGDSITAGASEAEALLGETRRGGVRIDRDQAR